MEEYFYLFFFIALVLQVTVYVCCFCVRGISPIRKEGPSVAAGARHPRGETGGKRQNLPQAKSLSPNDNQGMVECPVQPRCGDSLNPHGQFTGPPEYSSQEWKLPKYEEVTEMPPPYTSTSEEPEMASAVHPVEPVQITGPPQAYPGPASFQGSAHTD